MSESEENRTSRGSTPSDGERNGGKKDDDPKTLAAEIAQHVLAALQPRPSTSKGKYQLPPSTLADVILYGGPYRKNSRGDGRYRPRAGHRQNKATWRAFIAPRREQNTPG